MKKLFLINCILLALSAASYAQDCATGYCPANITVHHKAGSVSPVTGDITYGVDKNAYTGTTQCWITRNLGATSQATAGNDATVAAAGWNWQFNLKQGYSYNGSRVPATTWIASISDSNNWQAANDPCTLLLGATWRLPTNTEWGAVITAAAFSSGYAAAWSSTLKLHAAGDLETSGALNARGTGGDYWSSTQYSSTSGYVLYLSSGSGGTTYVSKAFGYSVRCLRTY